MVQKDSFLTYATKNLFIHAGKAAESRQDVIYNELHTLQQVAHRWAKVYNILEPHGDARPAEETTLLHIAAATNLVEIMDSILSNRVDIARRDGNGDTAFHLAARRGHIAAGKLLLEQGADREARSKDERTPLMEAASRGHVAFVQWLVCDESGDQTDEIEGALQAAAAGGHQNLVDILIRAGADPNSQGGIFGNALQAAAFGGNPEIVRICLDAHADVNAQGSLYGTALSMAVHRGKVEQIQILLNAGAADLLPADELDLLLEKECLRTGPASEHLRYLRNRILSQPISGRTTATTTMVCTLSFGLLAILLGYWLF